MAAGIAFGSPSQMSQNGSQNQKGQQIAGQQYAVLLHSTTGGRGSYQLEVRVDGESQVNADFDEDGRVGFSDFLILSANFGKSVDAVLQDGNADGDADVDFEDFLILSGDFGSEIKPA